MLRPTIEVPDFNTVLADHLGDIARDTTDAMQSAALRMKAEWREQVIGAGLGGRLANTIRANLYPRDDPKVRAKISLNPAAYVWTKAPKIIDAFSRGTTIRPHNGGRYLWIPTKNVPRRQYRGARRMSPDEVEHHFQAKFFFEKGDGRSFLAFIEVTRSKNLRTWRQDTRRRRAQGRRAQAVLMFTLVPSVRIPKKLDLNAVLSAGEAEFVRDLTMRIGR